MAEKALHRRRVPGSHQILSRYLGLPWVRGERDCWSFFREIELEYFDRDLPAIDIDAANLRDVLHEMAHHPERKRWRQVRFPKDGDGVLMSTGKRPFHVGVWLNGRVLHCTEGAGVVHQDSLSLMAHGWSNIRYYTPCF